MDVAPQVFRQHLEEQGRRQPFESPLVGTGVFGIYSGGTTPVISFGPQGSRYVLACVGAVIIVIVLEEARVVFVAETGIQQLGVLGSNRDR